MEENIIEDEVIDFIHSWDPTTMKSLFDSITNESYDTRQLNKTHNVLKAYKRISNAREYYLQNDEYLFGKLTFEQKHLIVCDPYFVDLFKSLEKYNTIITGMESIITNYEKERHTHGNLQSPPNRR